MNRDVFFLEDLLESQISQPFHKGYQVLFLIKATRYQVPGLAKIVVH